MCIYIYCITALLENIIMMLNFQDLPDAWKWQKWHFCKTCNYLQKKRKKKYFNSHWSDLSWSACMSLFMHPWLGQQQIQVVFSPCLFQVNVCQFWLWQAARVSPLLVYITFAKPLSFFFSFLIFDEYTLTSAHAARVLAAQWQGDA